MTGTDAPALDSVDRSGRMVLELEELLTIGVRLACGEPVPEGEVDAKRRLAMLLRAADESLRSIGYPTGLAKTAIHAVTAFLDETMARASGGEEGPTLSQKLFGDDGGGRSFFEHLSRVLASPPSNDRLDLLQVMHACLLLGFEGPFQRWNDAERRRIERSVTEALAEGREPRADDPHRGHAVTGGDSRGVSLRLPIAVLIGVGVLYAVLRWLMSLELLRLSELLGAIG